MSHERAVILAGGKGSRLRPYTVVLPKPLMPIGDHPILEVIIRQLAKCQFKHITMAVNHQADLIKAFFNTGSKWNVQIDYSLETQPLSTIGPLKLIPDLPDNFLLMNGDVLTDLNLRKLYDEHVSARRMFTIAASRRRHIVDYGVLDADGSGTLTGFREKPSFDYSVSMGVYVVNRRMLDMVPAGTRYGFDDLMLDSLKSAVPVHIHFHEGYWLDIGRVDDYMKAIDDYEERRNQLIPDDSQ
jgi:NDP-sugar pyrophosphorylase family protein